MHLLRLIALTTLSLSCLTLLPAPVHGMGAGRDDTEQHVAGGRLPPPTLEEPVEVRRGGQVFQMKRVKTVQLPDGREAVAQRLIVGFQDGVDERARARVHAAVQALGVAPVAWAQLGPAAHVVNLGPTDSLERALAAYRAQRGVRYVEPDYVARLSFTPNDPVFSSQWGMSKIQAPGAWDVTRGSPLRYVAIVDCGIYEQGSTTYGPGHDDINGKVVKRVDFVNESELPDDFCNHGTHVAGIAAANTNNGLGVAGVGFDTRLLNVKACNWLRYCLTSDVTSGIYWAADNGAHVVNLSLSGPGPCTTTYQDAINYAWARNLIIVAAAGNDSSSSPSTPASCHNVLAVAATDQSDLRAYFSNYGSWVDVAAPGTSIWSTDFVGGYVTKSGTSMATPHVAGLAALVWAANPSLSNQGVVDRIKSTADRIPGTGTYWEAGRINAASAVRSQPPSNPLLQIDVPASGATVRGTVTVGGWALDLGATSGTGVDQVHLYLDEPAGVGVGLGVATYGASRPDVGAVFGSQFTNSGWSFAWNTGALTPGSHTLYIYARSTVSSAWQLATRTVTVSAPTFPSDPLVQIDAPASGATVRGTVTVGGWALDRNAASGTGVDQVHLYLDAPAGQPGSVGLGVASYGGSRPDVGAAFGSQFTNSGWSFAWNTAGLSAGSHTLYVYAHSTASGVWQLATRTVTVQPAALLQIDSPASGATVSGVVTVGGWALDLGAPSGTGVDQVHLYLDGPAGAGGVGLGVASYGGSRPDVGAVFGSQFTNSGWSFAWNTSGLSPGTHTLYVYARSTVSGQWTLQTVSVTR